MAYDNLWNTLVEALEQGCGEQVASVSVRYDPPLEDLDATVMIHEVTLVSGLVIDNEETGEVDDYDGVYEAAQELMKILDELDTEEAEWHRK